jgi:hypothetical protein
MKQGGDASPPFLLNFVQNMPSGRSKKMRKDWNLLKHISFWSMLMIIGLKHKHHQENHRSVGG